MKKVLFICTHNSARSQMAEGLLGSLYVDIYDVFSAGIKPYGIKHQAIDVMEGIGIDIRAHRSKSVDEFLGIGFDYVVTVCEDAKDICPFFPGGKNYIHKGFEDPSKFRGTEDEELLKFREIRDEIKDWIVMTFGEK